MTIRASRKTPLLDRWARNSLITTPGLQAVKVEAIAFIDRNFLTKGARLGNPWPPLKYRKGEALRLTGAMYNSTGANSRIDAANKIVNIVTTKTTRWRGRTINIARAHNEGRGVPKREFLVLGKQDIKILMEEYAKAIYG